MKILPGHGVPSNQRYSQVRYILFFSVLVLFLGCSAAKLNRLKTCEYKYSGISDVVISGQKLDDLKTQKSAGFMGTSILGKLLFDKEAPMSFNVLIQVKNPNKKIATLDKIEWTALIQDKEFLSGIYNQHFEVKPGETALLSIPVSFDLKQQISGENGAAIKTFGMAYLMNGSAKGLSLKIRPYVGGIKLPTSFDINPFQQK